MHRFCVAPMMSHTDRHCRYFLRLWSKRAMLYTEMISAEALRRQPDARRLRFSPAEAPVGLQLGGGCPETLAEAAAMGARANYDEVNLNVGCPSPRASGGELGACLMREGARVAECIEAMSRSQLPVTVKCRTGVDEDDDYDFLARFCETVAAAGCKTLIVHARKAWLSGLSPRQNRSLPPLHYDRVHRLKRDFAHMTIVINGGIKNLDDCKTHLAHVDGVMLGRAPIRNPALLGAVDGELFDDPRPAPKRERILAALLPYLREHLAAGEPAYSVLRHTLGLYHGESGARAWRRFISERAHQSDLDSRRLLRTLEGGLEAAIETLRQARAA